jgi:tetratricopeptide (TPR) repeat protein
MPFHACITKNKKMPKLIAPAPPPFQAIALFCMTLLVTMILYWQGLNSPFVLDDQPNLVGMGQYHQLGFWRDLLLLVLNSNTGPTGRPISMASFYINDLSWQGANPADFKYTNLMLHLLNGILLYWLSHKLASRIKLTDRTRNLLTVSATALWLLHPMQVNTVLYVVQRMTELSVLFTLAGLLCYLQGRKHFTRHPVKGWLWLLLGVGSNLVLATLSKENGVLLAAYILVIEYFLIRPLESKSPPSLNKGLLVIAWLPLAWLAYFLLFVVTPSQNYANRPFTLTERLLTEPRVLWDYINNILLPGWSGNSLFHDDFTLSTSWLAPFTTLPALLALMALVASLFLLRKRQPVAAFAIAWFIGGHLLESTSVALEIYFEHRNYLPLYGFAFAIPYYLLTASQHLPNTKYLNLTPAALAIYLLTLASITLHHVQLWTKPPEMVISWLEAHPHSQRTLEMLDTLIGEHLPPGQRDKLHAELKQASVDTHTSSYLVIKDLIQECKTGTLSPQKLQQAIAELQTAGFVDAASELYANLVSEWETQRCGQQISANDMQDFSSRLQKIPHLQRDHMPYLLEYWQAQIQLTQGNLEQTMRHLEAAYALSPDVDLVLLQANYLSSAGLLHEAMGKLQQAEHDLCRNWRQCLILEARRPDIDNMRVLLEQKLLKEAKVTPHEQVLPVDHFARQE